MDQGRCRDLRVEYLHEPTGVGTARPRFSWIAEHEQSGYRLIVAAADGRTVWDSGRVASAETSLIDYAGEPLASDAAFTWSVQSWGAAEADPLAAASRFETAVLDPSTWTASWITPQQQPTAIERWTLLDWIRGAQPEGAPTERLRPVQLLRRRFTAGDDVVRARLHATARGVYLAHLNGAVVGDEVLAPGSDSYRRRIAVQAYDVTDLIRAGENVLAVALADGWWAGRIGITGSSAQYGDTTSAFWQLHLDHADGTRTVVGSDGDAVSATGPWVYADLFVGERYDRRLLDPGWTRVDFDDAAWLPVEAVPGDTAVLVPFTGEPVRRVRTLGAASLVPDPDGDGWIVDFGQVIAGRVRLTVRGLAAGDEVVVEHTEALAADGSWFVNILGINTEQTDVYVAAGPEEDTWEPSFTFHGFRYARLTGLREAPRAEDVVAVVLSSDLEQTGSFQGSDARLNRLHENVVWSQRGNFVSIPTDCPQRERAGWTGDIQVFAPAATNNALVAPFLDRWLRNLRADQFADGRVPIVSPRSPFDDEAAASAQGIGAIVAAAGWGDAIAFVPWALYERYGDVRVLEESFPAILAWIDHQATDAYADGDHFGDWLAPSTLEGRPFHEAIGVAPALTGRLVAPMFRARTLTVAAGIAQVLGQASDAVRLAERAAEVRDAFAAEHVAADGSLPVELQGVYTLALAFGMVPEDRIRSAAAHLARLVTERGDRLDTGFLSVPYLLDVLWDHGYPELARRVLWQPAQPSWLYEVDHGATTIWENWDAVAPDGTTRPTSLNHYAFGCVDDWLYRRVAGLRSTAPGWRHAVVEPDLDAGVDEVAAHVTTPYGRLAVHWQRAGDDARITVEVPHGVAAELAVGGRRLPLPPGVTEHTLPLSLPTPLDAGGHVDALIPRV